MTDIEVWKCLTCNQGFLWRPTELMTRPVSCPHCSETEPDRLRRLNRSKESL